MPDRRPGAKPGVPRRNRPDPASVEPGQAVIGRAAHDANQRRLVGERIRGLRVSQGLTQVQLAARIQKSERTVAGWERGGWTPRALELLSAALKAPVSHFFGRPARHETRGAPASNSFGLELERRVVDAIVVRGIAPDTATLLLPTAATLSSLAVEALADGAVSRHTKTLLSDAAGGRLLAVVEVLRARIEDLDAEEDRAARFTERDAQVYRACWHRDRRTGGRRPARRESVLLRGADEMDSTQRELAALDLLRRLPGDRALAVALKNLGRDGITRLFAILREAQTFEHARQLANVPEVGDESSDSPGSIRASPARDRSPKRSS